MNKLAGIIKSLFTRKILIYTAVGQDQYFKIVDKLNNQGIKYSTKVHVGTRGKDYFRSQFMMYDIYINAEDETKAVGAIKNKRS